MKVSILLIEDELIIAEDMRMILEGLGYEVLGIATDYSEAMELLEQNTPDIVLADIMLGGSKDGVDLAKEIRKKYELPLIFATSHSDKFTLDRAKEVKPNGYLVKPFDEKDLFAAIEVALANFAGAELNTQHAGNEPEGMLVRDSVYVKERHHFVKVNLNELRWIMVDGNYLELHAEHKRYVIRSSLRDFLDKLRIPRFHRVHKSFAVNLECIDAVNSDGIIVGNTTIPMGRNYRDDLLQKLNTI
ncbi:MAG: response regulator [Flavobacteriales bacterium]